MTRSRLVHIQSAPGSGKTTVAAIRYGFQRYNSKSSRGTLGLSFARSAAAELSLRVTSMWGSQCIQPPHALKTIDQLHVDILNHCIRDGTIKWPYETTLKEVVDNYEGFDGFIFLKQGEKSWRSALDENQTIKSKREINSTANKGIRSKGAHQKILKSGILSHEDVRGILTAGMKNTDIQDSISEWLASNYHAILIDEVYDANSLDLEVINLAAEAGLAITLIGDPWQALYEWRGATPRKIEDLKNSVSGEFRNFELTKSFRFTGNQMPTLATKLRSGCPVQLEEADSTKVDVVLCRNWANLWDAGDNVLPLAFATITNNTDAALNLLLDEVTRSRLGRAAFGRDVALKRLGLDSDNLNVTDHECLKSLLNELTDESISSKEILVHLRSLVKGLGGKRVPKLGSQKEARAESRLSKLRRRMSQRAVIPGLTIFQAKGLEWDRVGLKFSEKQIQTLKTGLKELELEHCIIYVGITRAREYCCLIT